MAARKSSSSGRSKLAPPRVTIQDVARAAGVSGSSISNYMNKRFERLGGETRLRIEEAIAQLNFRPNRVARQLKTGRSDAIALIVPSVVNPYSGELVLAIEQEASRAGYGVHMCNTMRSPAIETDFLDRLADIGVRRIISVSPMNSTCGLYYGAREDVSIVAIDASRDDFNLPGLRTVNLDHRAAMDMAVAHLRDLGHERIAYVTDSLITHSRVDRMKGFSLAVERYNIRASEIVMVENRERVVDIADLHMVDAGRRAAADVTALASRPTAVVAFNDMIAHGLMAGFRAVGISVPSDISLIGVDDIWMNEAASPGLTSIRHPIAEMAKATIRHLSPSADDPADYVLLPSLVTRQTTRAPASDPATDGVQNR